MDNISIIDNFFDKNDLYNIISFFKTHGWNSLCMTYTNNKGTDVPFWKVDLNTYTFFTYYLNNIIKNKIKKNGILIRVYAICQTYGQTSNFHIDSMEKNHYTFCYYINEDIDDSGYIFIRIPNTENIICIEPIMNRSVLFPSNYVHKGNELNNTQIRICIVWKYEEII